MQRLPKYLVIDIGAELKAFTAPSNHLSEDFLHVKTLLTGIVESLQKPDLYDDMADYARAVADHGLWLEEEAIEVYTKIYRIGEYIANCVEGYDFFDENGCFMYVFDRLDHDNMILRVWEPYLHLVGEL